jgi:hypothetical protein
LLLFKILKTNTQESFCSSSCFLASQGTHEVTTIASLSVDVGVSDHEGRNSAAPGFNLLSCVRSTYK